MDRVARWMDFFFVQRRWFVHVAFWFVILIFYALFFGRNNDNYWQTFFFVGLLMPVTVGSTYLINYYLVPQFLINGRYALFLLYSFYILLIALFLEMLVALLTFIGVAGLHIRDMSPASFDVVFMLTSLLMVIFLGVAIKMISHWRQSREDYQKLTREKVEAELKLLRAQLNPHFLFNTLNNLYYLTTQKSDLAPRAILQLSEILDYVLRSGKAMQVSFEEELYQVENYIALELLRYGDRVTVTKKLDFGFENFQIPPMILLTLVENCFKHGVEPFTNGAWIELKIDTNYSGVSVDVRNSSKSSSVNSGVGLRNLKSQLELIYRDRFEYSAVKMEGEYRVRLNLPKS